jgi:hypothetical protein
MDRQDRRPWCRARCRGEHCHQRLVLPVDHLLDGAAVQRLAVAGTLDAPRRHRILGERGRRQAGRGNGQHEAQDRQAAAQRIV